MAIAIRKVLKAEDTGSTPFARRLMRSLSALEIEDASGQEHGSEIRGKHVLQIGPFPGEFLKKCPGTKGYLCCGYRILHIGANCPMDCSYCILQAYLNQPNLRVFTNLEDKLSGLAQLLDEHPESLFRIGTGEFMDSLALDPVTGWTEWLLPFFAVRKNAVLELKTKSVNVNNILGSKFRDRIIVSWSLNSPFMASHEEHGAPSIKQRIEAAAKCQSEGFIVGFHFDPLVPHPGWKEGYLRTLEMLEDRVDPQRVIWLSMGCMRYLPELKPIIRNRWPRSRVLDGEFIVGLDGKMRLFKPIRIELVGFMAENLARWHKDLGAYLCMESPDVWEAGMGWAPQGPEGLSEYLDGRVRRIMMNAE